MFGAADVVMGTGTDLWFPRGGDGNDIDGPRLKFHDDAGGS